jgi:hypothetical protein
VQGKESEVFTTDLSVMIPTSAPTIMRAKVPWRRDESSSKIIKYAAKPPRRPEPCTYAPPNNSRDREQGMAGGRRMNRKVEELDDNASVLPAAKLTMQVTTRFLSVLCGVRARGHLFMSREFR